MFAVMHMSSWFSPSPDEGDRLAGKLLIGMSSSEVETTIGAPSNVFRYGDVSYLTYTLDRTPYDVLREVADDTLLATYPYWFGSSQHSLFLFFDDKKRLRGWFKNHSEWSRDKFNHERLTSKIDVGMNRAKVHDRIGKPESVVPLPVTKSPAFYDDRYWTEEPLDGFNKEMEVYSYDLPGGQRRHVYLMYLNNDKLKLWGYDHAWQEAERYLAEQAAKKKSQ